MVARNLAIVILALGLLDVQAANLAIRSSQGTTSIRKNRTFNLDNRRRNKFRGRLMLSITASSNSTLTALAPSSRVNPRRAGTRTSSRSLTIQYQCVRVARRPYPRP